MSKTRLFTAVKAILVLLQITNIAAQASQVRNRLLTPEEGCGISKVANSKIVGGTEARPGQYPWLAQLIYKNSIGEVATGCGGTLITSRHVLTAAHCVSPKLSHVRLGEHDISSTNVDKLQDYEVNEAIRHPNFGREFKQANDIAILILEEHVEFNDRVRPICMPFSEKLKNSSYVGFNPFIAGWGDLELNGPPSDVLMHVQVTVIDNAKCKELYRMQGELTSENEFGDGVICAGNLDGGQGSCEGDSGGPLMLPILEGGAYPMYQIGIISYGLDCSTKDAPGAYTRVQYFMHWIQEIISQTVE